jgi:hypothetical protein
MLIQNLALGAALSVAVAAPALSQEPSPSPSVLGQQEQSQTTPPDKTSNTQQRGTEEAPLIVKVVPPQNTEASRADEAQERKDKAALDRRLVDLTGELASYTGKLFHATAILACATVVLVVATVGLIFIGRRQERMARTHERAYVLWGGLYCTPKRTGKQRESVSHDAADYEAPWRMQVHNFGRTPGFITRVRWGKCKKSEFETKTATETLSGLIKNGKLRIMEDKQIEAVVSPTANYLPATYRHVDMGPVFYGIINYRDVFKDAHYSTFAVINTEHATDAVGSFMATDWT